VFLPDRHDIWAFPTGPKGSPDIVTAGEGRKENRSFRIILPDPERKFIRKSERLLLASTHLRDKNRGFYEAIAGTSGVTRLLEDRKNFTFKARAKDSGTILFTREDYREFPDLWTTDAAFGPARKISEANPQISEFAWGEAELVEWTSDDGRPLQGVLIKPGGYEPGRRYPVLVYYYEISSDRLYDFNEIVVNHRPCFPVYAGHGYAVFLPDIRFTVGRPGMSAVHCLVPGVRKLIDMGLADPKAVGLHGHSWGGYETAFVVTRTDLFAAACAGAPVGNMTSAYSGIRWESGMARQFQYEREQSRIGASLWDARDLYIENSPVFFADRIKTPLLLMHGDEDGAVPWYQSIELYLALRRLGKDCFFLQYRGEPHHPKTYANKLDYSIKMMEFFDHYLKGAPAADWIKTGVPYNGK
ncbi:MAG: prolyl oligopeptidase family serine peptidase, partial [Acidobacteriota bacterium]|nr:prolyl oligopeptidase family serine peptidase [Acidobacteriota bacterium]